MKRKEPYYPLTFDTGITVMVRKTSPMLIQEVQKAFPPPKPPMNKVDYGNGFHALEANVNDPDYQQALKQYNEELEARVRKLMIIRGVDVEIDHEAVNELREQMREIGIELDKSDKLVYVSMIAMGTAEDYQDLINAITRRSQATEDAVADAVATFQHPVQERGHLQLEDTEERRDIFAAV